MKSEKTITIIVLFILLFSQNLFSQEITRGEKTNAEYIVNLIKTTEVELVIILAVGLNRDYKEEWLNNITTEGNLITFRSKGRIQIWDVSNIGFIEKYSDILKIRLTNKVGI